MIPLNLNRLGSQRGELDLEHKGKWREYGKRGKEFLCMGGRKAKGKVQLEKINN